MFGHKSTIKKLTLAISLALPFGLYAAEKDVDKKNEKVTVASSTTGSKTTQLSEITVTDSGVSKGYTANRSRVATKTDTRLQDTPISVQVVTREVIDDQASNTILDVVKNVSGIQAPPGGYYDNFYIRGFSTSVDTYRNGLKLNSMRGVPDMAFVDHIEVAKGPSSMLYGRVQPGGLVNTVTKRPQAQAAYSIQQKFSSWDNYRTVIDATGGINADNTLRYRIMGAYDTGNSWVDLQQHDNLAGSINLSWIPSSRFELNMQIEGYDKKMTNVAYTAQQIPVPTGRNRPLNLPRNWTQNDPVMWSNYPAVEKSALFSYDWTFAFNDNWKLINRFGYSIIDDTQSMMTPLAFTPSTGLMTRRINYNVIDRNVLTTNLDLIGNFSTWGVKHKLLTGFDYTYHRTTYKGYRQSGTLPTPGVPALNVYAPTYGNVNIATLTRTINPSLSNILYYQNMDNPGVYIQDQISLGDHLEVLLGARHDWTFEPVTVSNMVGTTGAACYPKCDGRLNPNTPKEQATSPRAGLLYKFSDQFSLYGSYSKSFGSSNSSAQTYDGSRPPPQIGVQYEVGGKASLWDDTVTASVTLFDLYQRNRMTADPSHTGFSLPVGEVRSKGIELDVAGQITKHINLIGSYTYNDAEIIKDSTAGAASILGKTWLGVPKNSGSIWAKYDFTPEAADSWALGAGAYLNGMRQGNNANTFQLPGYTRIDTMLSYRTKAYGHSISAQLNVQNLFDRHYFEATDGGSNAYYGAPRTISGTVSFRF
ncbi:MAG: TonB-dependent siderophore receptor [Methylococcales bacterium]|nr:TonB-dependent siderophore receptor [Methylococcales bacterium]